MQSRIQGSEMIGYHIFYEILGIRKVKQICIMEEWH